MQLVAGHPRGVSGFLIQHYRPLSLGVLALALFNLTFRIGRESVGEWDESLYALTAWEMLRSNSYVATTFHGVLDYYNSKPPLNVWLVATSFSMFGVNLTALRVWSVLAGWLAVWTVQRWTRAAFGAPTSILSSLVLATMFGFLHQHSARTGNADALLALLILLVVVTLWSAQHRMWRLTWLGPICAAVCLLKGMAVLLPLLLIGLVEGITVSRGSRRWRPLAAAAAMFVLPVGAWVAGRWQVDGPLFFQHLFGQDLVGVSLRRLEGHEGGPFYYLYVLQRNQLEWVLAGLAALVLLRRSWRSGARTFRDALKDRRLLPVLFLGWTTVTLLVPSMMQTRVFWYLNPFYPLFAVLVGLALAEALGDRDMTAWPRRITLATALTVTAVTVAEARTVWRIYRVRNADRGVQGVMVDRRDAPRPCTVFRDRHLHSEEFVTRAIMGCDYRDDFAGGHPPAGAVPGDLIVVGWEIDHPRLHLVRQTRQSNVYEFR
jgi:4-amino-4-deoxy-L-arabinose transferase-like glycosyltransferase